MSTNLFEIITSEENIDKAYVQTQKADGKFKKDAMIFSRNEVYNLKKLRHSLIDGTYEFGKYNRFMVHEPKERIIDAPEYKDKIVQIAINNVLKEVYYPCFIHDSYSCIDNKGTHKCVDKIQHFMRKAKWQYGEDTYIIKIDIKKFFYTIDREILKHLLAKKIECKRTLELIYKIIDSADMIDEFGLPLGNTLSQLCANIYMNKADQYAKRTLSLKYYVRYADDIIVVVENKSMAQCILKQLTEYIHKELNLDINKKKTKIFPINQGINTIGFKIHTTHRLLRNDSKKRIKRKVKKVRHLLIDGIIKIEKAEQMFNSWKGHAEHGSSYNFIQRLIYRNDYIYMSDKGLLKINNKILQGR